MIQSPLVGWLGGFFMVSALLGSLSQAYRMHRSASGLDEAQADLEIILRDVEASYARDGRLCAPSRIESDEPLRWVLNGTVREASKPEEREGAGVGFHCLRLDPTRLTSSRNMYTYDVDGDRFVVRAFRASLYDPDGVLPRYERRGEVKNGRVLLSRRIERLRPGGPAFRGHPGPLASVTTSGGD